MSDVNPEPTAEEMEFLQSELDIMVKQYRLEDFGDNLTKTLTLLNQMINAGLIEESREGIMKGLKIIVRVIPEVDDSFRRFALAVFDKTIDEIKQMEKPN